MPGLFQHGKIDNVLTEGDTNSRLAIARFKDTERQILERKLRILFDFDKRSKSHAYDLTTKITESTKSSFSFPLFKRFVVFVSFVVIKTDRESANLRAARRSCSCQMKSR